MDGQYLAGDERNEIGVDHNSAASLNAHQLDSSPFQTQYQTQYQNFVGGSWVAPLLGRQTTRFSPLDGQVISQIARSTTDDLVFALGAAHGVSIAWAEISSESRSALFRKITTTLEENANMMRELLGQAEGKPLNRGAENEVAQAIAHFRYASMSLSDYRDPLFMASANVAVQFLPQSYALVVAAWAITQALGRGACLVLRPEISATLPVLLLVDLISKHLPAGVLNIVTGYDHEIDSTVLGQRSDVNTAALFPVDETQNVKPAQVFFADICDELDYLQMSAVESFSLFAQNQGLDVFTPSRVFVQASIYEKFVSRALGHLSEITRDTEQNGAAIATLGQCERTLSYVQIARNEGAILKGGGRKSGFGSAENYVQPTVFEGNNEMRIFQERVGGPILSLAPFNDLEHVTALVNAAEVPLAAGVWCRSKSVRARFRAACNAPFVWENEYFAYPQHPSFAGFQQPYLEKGSPISLRSAARYLLRTG